MAAKLYKFHVRVGCGGIKCSCCTIGGPTAHKRLNNRRFRRAEKKWIKEKAEA